MPATATKPRNQRARKHAPFTVPHFRAWAHDLILDNGEPWIVESFFEDFCADYFTGVPECWLIVPEGNTKTTSLGGLAVYLLEHRTQAEIPWAASARDQAEIGYRQAAGFVNRSPRLSQFIRCYDGYRRIVNTETTGRIQIFAADAGTGDGVIFTDAFLDELHRHRDLELYRTWSGKLDKRQGQMATISTAGLPGSPFEVQRELIRQTVPVVKRKPGFVHCRSESTVLHEYAVPENGNVEDMRVVKLANPASVITVESLAKKRARPTMTLSHWSRLTCNLATRGSDAAITEIEWDGAGVDETIPDGEPRGLGLDVGWKWDTTALVPLWVRDADFRLFGPATILEPPRDGTSLDPHLVEEALLAEAERGPIHTVVMDTTRAEQLASWIEERLGARVIDRGQTNTFATTDYERFMEGLRNGWLKHTRDPGLSRHVLNASARQLSGGGIRFDRSRQSRHALEQDRYVIDALSAAAMINTILAAELHVEPEEQREVMVAWS